MSFVARLTGAGSVFVIPDPSLSSFFSVLYPTLPSSLSFPSTCSQLYLLSSLLLQEFVPISDISAPNSASTFSTSYSATPTSPSYLLTKPRENPYTKVCALRRQSSSASLSSLSSSVGNAGPAVAHALDNSKRLNHSLDDNMSRHAARRQRRTSSKAHQSLDESKMLALIEGSTTKSVQELSASEDTDDDVFDRKEMNSASPPEFHESNPFKEDAQQPAMATANARPGRAFLCSSSSSSVANLQEEETRGKNILNVSNMIAKQLVSNASESVKRVSSTSGGHFKDLKEKIAASSRIAGGIGDGADKTPPKLVKNFNEFLNFATINKNRISDRLANQLQISEKPQQTKPLQLSKSGALASSLDESDSSSVPETSWSASTAATAIQQAQDLSSYSLQLDLNSVSPERTPEKQPKQTPAGEESTPDQDQDQEYYPMSTAITRELRLDADNLDRQVFGLPFTEKQQQQAPATAADIEYEKLDKDSLDMVDDIKENEIITCPDVSELHQRRRQRMAAAKSNSVQPPEMTLNPFIDESQLHEGSSGGGGMRSSSSLPEVIMPISTEPNRVEAPTLVEIATNADDESAYAYTRSPQRSGGTSTTPLNGLNSTAAALPPPGEFGGGNAFLMFLCLTLLLQHRNTIIKASMDYNEIAMHFDKMVRKHDVTRVLNQARRMYIEYLQAHRKQPQTGAVPASASNSSSSTSANAGAEASTNIA